MSATQKKEQPKAPQYLPGESAAGPVPVERPKASSRKPHPLTDPRYDGFVHVGFFAEVTGGKHDRRYGVVELVSDDYKTATLRTRDDESELITVKYEDLKPAVAGRR